MKTKLPLFEGLRPKGALIKLSGGSDSRVGALNMDEEVFFVVKGSVTQITHGDVREELTRSHKVSATHIVILDPNDGRRMLEEASALADERFGLENLFKDAATAVGADPETGEIGEEE